MGYFPKLRLITLFVGLVLLAFPSAARADRVDDLVRSELARQKITGLSIAVVHNGRIVKAAGYGLCNVELDVPAKPETIYESASMGKQLVAGAIMLLVKDGRIGLDDNMRKYLPDTPPAWQGITVRHLLTHTSGLGDSYKALDLRKDYTEDEVLKAATTVPVHFAPGEKWEYSDTGYQMLGFIVHKVTGQFYGDFLHDRIFLPAGMATARVISEADIVPNRSAGYRRENGILKNQGWVSPTLNTLADGSLYVSVLDMARWDIALLGGTVIPRSMVEQMWTPARLNDGTTHAYGFGFSLGSVRGHRIAEHAGAWQGFTTFNAIYPDENLAVVVLTNMAGAQPARIAHAIAGLYNPALAPDGDEKKTE